MSKSSGGLLSVGYHACRSRCLQLCALRGLCDGGSLVQRPEFTQLLRLLLQPAARVVREASLVCHRRLQEQIALLCLDNVRSDRGDRLRGRGYQCEEGQLFFEQMRLLAHQQHRYLGHLSTDTRERGR